MYKQRSQKQLLEHYEIEKELGKKLLNATREDRRMLYASLYDELYRRVPHHPQLTRKSSPEQVVESVASQMKFLRPFLKPSSTFMEIGPGDCSLSFEVAKYVKHVCAIDVSKQITAHSVTPDNFDLVLSDGCSIPVTKNSIDVAYSNQLMEHLHPDDALEQLRNICDALVVGGIYICTTCNRITGPHDISKGFDSVSTGLHLKEYTLTEINRLFRMTGFSDVSKFLRVRGSYITFPILPSVLFEWLLNKMPCRFANMVAIRQPCRFLLSVRLVGCK
jgi:SAM-dependent methyltransferase